MVVMKEHVGWPEDCVHQIRNIDLNRPGGRILLNPYINIEVENGLEKK